MAAALARRVSVPSDLVAAAELERIDYADAFAVPDRGTRTAERWLAAVLEGSPGPALAMVRAIWLAVGADVEPLGTPGHLFGCPLTVDGPDRAKVDVVWRSGLRGTILLDRADERVVFATVVQLGNPAVRALWTVLSPLHRVAARVGMTLAGRSRSQKAGQGIAGP